MHWYSRTFYHHRRCSGATIERVGDRWKGSVESFTTYFFATVSRLAGPLLPGQQVIRFAGSWIKGLRAKPSSCKSALFLFKNFNFIQHPRLKIRNNEKSRIDVISELFVTCESSMFCVGDVNEMTWSFIDCRVDSKNAFASLDDK